MNDETTPSSKRLKNHVELFPKDSRLITEIATHLAPPGLAELVAEFARPCIYLIGGVTEKGRTQAVLRWNGERWARAPDLPFPMRSLQALVHENKIKIVGGSDGDCEPLQRLFDFDGVRWTESKRVSCGLKRFALVKFQDKWWQIGGCTRGGSYRSNQVSVVFCALFDGC